MDQVIGEIGRVEQELDQRHVLAYWVDAIEVREDGD